MTEKQNCSLCWKYHAGFCKQWKQKISDTTVAETCEKFSAEKKLNKGMQIRQNKLDKKAKKRAEIKPEQQDLVRFVEYSEKVIERINGKFRHPTRTERGKGLQIKNKIFLENGRYKMVNRSTLKIKKTYDVIPQWAGKHLTDLYNRAKNKSDELPATRSPRKRCSTCVHFLYGAKRNKLGYYCELTEKMMSDYNHLEYCMAPMYKRKS